MRRAGLGWSPSDCVLSAVQLHQPEIGLPARVIWIDRLSGFQAPRCARGISSVDHQSPLSAVRDDENASRRS